MQKFDGKHYFVANMGCYELFSIHVFPTLDKRLIKKFILEMNGFYKFYIKEKLPKIYATKTRFSKAQQVKFT